MENFYAIIDSTNTVVNIINWDGKSPWQPEAGYQAIKFAPDQFVDIGWLYVDGNFVPPQPIDTSSVPPIEA